jgi:hypothetical protein
MVDKTTFGGIVQKVIDTLEGGYYNPAWHSVGDARYSTSGETMFGIDRKQGGTINTSAEGKEFWGIIDKNKTKAVWKWNYKGGDSATKLKQLAGAMVYPKFITYSKTWLSPGATAIVEKDPRLIFHFAYATWNGPGWFKKFAEDMNKAVASGTKSPDKLAKIAIDSRTKEGLKKGSKPDSLVVQGGNKIAKLFSIVDTGTKFVNKHLFILLGVSAAIGVGLYFLIRKK